jgi:hypothetical protein
MLDKGDYEGAANVIATSRHLGRDLFLSRIRDRFGARASESCPLRGPILLVPALARGPVLTSNYDRLLERVFRQVGRPFANVAWGPRSQIWAEALNRDQPNLLKIHGDGEDQQELVLSKSDYDRHYGRRRARWTFQAGPRFDQPLVRALVQVFSRRSILFVGCSLAPDRTLGILRAVTALGAPNHYAVIERPRGPARALEREKALRRCGISPLWYPSGEHHLVEVLLRHLLDRPERRNRTRTFQDDFPDVVSLMRRRYAER